MILVKVGDQKGDHEVIEMAEPIVSANLVVHLSEDQAKELCLELALRLKMIRDRREKA